MEARLIDNCLKIGNLASFCADGRVKIQTTEDVLVENLCNSLIDFAGLIMDKSREITVKTVFYGNLAYPRVIFKGEIEVEYDVLKRLKISFKDKIKGSVDFGKKTALLDMGAVVFHETLESEWLILEKFENLTLEKKIGYPAHFLTGKTEGKNFVLYDRHGNLVFELEPKGYNLKTLSLVGGTTKVRDEFLKWLENSLFDALDYEFKKYEETEGTYDIFIGNFYLVYQKEKAELIYLNFLASDLLMYSTAGGFSLKSSDGRINYDINIGKRKPLEKIGKKIWETLKFLIF